MSYSQTNDANVATRTTKIITRFNNTSGQESTWLSFTSVASDAKTAILGVDEHETNPDEDFMQGLPANGIWLDTNGNIEVEITNEQAGDVFRLELYLEDVRLARA